ncbi:Rieske (2Fe-2S) protein [Halospeciosus flavus]|uniref:Rieske (2Fe-2S) protein n=1 Tax=Halospeciosus flavus TaxID=3032283 RepID=A0ABD5Z762_9EURY|nr:Rieske 2Fe-2S domain-containing protein [Halospeciosus flavus]
MVDRTELTSVDEVYEKRSWLFTVRDDYGAAEEVVLVPCEDTDERAGESESEHDGAGPVEAWINRCTHESQRLDRGFGVAMRDGQIICPKHGSMFDACSGYCDNGEAADTTLVSVDVETEDGTVYLVDPDYTFDHAGEADEGETDDEGPSSTSHLGF